MKPETRNSKPSVSPARSAAFDILLRVEQQGAYASELLHSSQFAQLSPADHGLATELVMGVLRWRSTLDRVIAAASSQALERLDLEVLTALRLGVYQLRFLERVPARAAVYESVDLVKRARKRSAAPFANAVLRKLSTLPVESRELTTVKGSRELAERYAHPQWLVERWVKAFGMEAARHICAYGQQVPRVAIRLDTPQTEVELARQGIHLTAGSLLASARLVTSGDVTATPEFRKGRVAVQDEASQLVAVLVGRGSRILDCCAAPGSKTAILANRNPDSEIVAVDLHPHRARLLSQRVQANNVRVIAADACSLPLSGQFNRVLVDVPCSGSGTLARNPEIKWRLKTEDLADLHSRQVAILKSAMQRVAPNGKLIYSTCSLEPEESSEVIDHVLAGDKSFRLIDCRQELDRLQREGELVWSDLGSLTHGLYLRTLPGVHPCDGFFAVVLERT